MQLNATRRNKIGKYHLIIQSHSTQAPSPPTTQIHYDLLIIHVHVITLNNNYP